MAELGHRGGKAKRRGAVERLPAGERESLRQHLRANLAPADVLEAVQRSLGGANESARVAAVRLISDLELYRGDDGCARCAEAAAEREANADKARASVTGLVVDAVVQIIEADPHPVGLARLAADLLDERQQRRLKDLRTLKLDQIRAASADELTREALAGA